MNSFDELGLDDALVEALAAEGIETPTAFQNAAMPVIRRGNNVVGLAGPGGGALVAYGAAVLDRLDAEGPPARVLILSPTAESAQRNAESLARLAITTGHTVAALGSPWLMPDRASILFGTPDLVMAAVRSSEIKLEGVETLVVDGVAAMLELQAQEALEQVFECVPQAAQRVVLSLPMSKAAADLADRNVRKAVHLPPRAVGGEPSGGIQRGVVQFAAATGDRLDALLYWVDAAFKDECRHVIVFFGSEDLAADGGDFLALHGFQGGEPGDPAVPVWLGTDELAARAARTDNADPDSVQVISFDVPRDPDSLDRRHGGAGGTILVLPRELPHLRATARQAGYEVRPAPETTPNAVRTELVAMRKRVIEAVEDRDLGGALLVLEPLFESYAPAEVAAALLTIVQDRTPPPAQAPAPAMQAPSWTRLFVSVGSRDGVGPGDLVGAISGEAGVAGGQVGKIEIRDTFSLVEVDQTAADRVIKALNGTTLRGRSARVDYDRGSRPGGRSPRPQARP